MKSNRADTILEYNEIQLNIYKSLIELHCTLILYDINKMFCQTNKCHYIEM